MDLNQVNLLGRVTKDPEIRVLPSGTKVAKFGLATTYKYKNPTTQQKVEEVSFHNIVAFAGLAGIIESYVKKGQLIYIGGRIKYGNYENKQGGKTYTFEIVAVDMQMGPRAANDQSQRQQTPADTVKQAFPDETLPTIQQGEDFEASLVPPATSAPSDEDISVDDIPF